MQEVDRSSDARSQLEQMYHSDPEPRPSWAGNDDHRAFVDYVGRAQQARSRRTEGFMMGVGITIAVSGLVFAAYDYYQNTHPSGYLQPDPVGYQPYQPPYQPYQPAQQAVQQDESLALIPGMNATKSAITGIVDPNSLTAVYYWTLSLKNSSNSEHEAEMEMTLPKGAVVSRATLWINDVPQEAAFNTTASVTRAYEWITKKHRDPLLVTQIAPGRIKIKAAPVLPNGPEMKLRIGITAPMGVDDSGQAKVLLPEITATNTAVNCRQDVHLESSSRLSTDASDSWTRVERKKRGYVLKANVRAEDLSNLSVSALRKRQPGSFTSRATHSANKGLIVTYLEKDEKSNLWMPAYEKRGRDEGLEHIADENVAHRVSTLWAAGEIEKLVRNGQTNTAADLANTYRIVSSISGATVLETESDYEYNRLNRDMNRSIAYTGSGESQLDEGNGNPTASVSASMSAAPDSFDNQQTTGTQSAQYAPVNAFVEAPRLQGATNGTIGPQGEDATVITGVNTAGTVRVNNLANLEAFLNVIANGFEGGFLVGAILLLVRALFVGRASMTVMKRPITLNRLHCVGVATLLAGIGFGIPSFVNLLVATMRDLNMFS